MNRLTLILGAIVACGLAYGAGQWMGYDRGADAAKAGYDAALAEAERANAEAQKVLIRQIERVAEDAEQERLAVEDRLAAAGDAVDRLRDTIRRADTNPDPSATPVADATRARALLADCAARYRDMAGQADRLRATVIGLQAYAREVSGPN